jgi:predicted metal-binding membrane protein
LDDTHANPFSAQRSIILGLLLVLAADSWVMLVWQSAVSDADMAMTSASMGMSSPPFLVIMMVAMMLPSATPMVLSFFRVQASNQRQLGVTFVSTSIFVAAYIVMWTLAGAPAYAGAIAFQIFAGHGMLSPATAARLGGVLLLAHAR